MIALNRLLGNETRINLSFVACIDDVESDAKPRLPLLSSAGPTRCLSRPTRSSLAGANNSLHWQHVMHCPQATFRASFPPLAG